ncbi:hypothetical protein TRFO_30171 [Tritrichomonas foetus]|uniref:Sulfatase N-terminal domain-containing protein n=1 Tax=Tritrichomonas foetus TaxID=1144522 RepID=A0A1J4JU62_9EUKA|nr:hypothetical protein TRFO_30171 [Tritrichomonas foetus]|eukprot:OHT02673.1 hypothetical protein TRFO_30171 [Tritrichomonas foetus]
MRLLPGPYLMSIMVYIPMALLILCKFAFNTTSKLTILGERWRVLPELFIQACDVAFFACIHFWIHKLFEKKLKIPTLPLNIFFYALYFLFFGFSVYDFENTRHNMQSIMYSTLKAYIASVGGNKFTAPLHMVSGEPGQSDSFMNIVYTTILDAPLFWGIFIIFMFAYFIFCIILLFKFKEVFFAACKSKIKDYMYESDENDDSNDSYGSNESKNMKYGCYNFKKRSAYMWVPANEYNNFLFNIYHCLGIFYLIFTICYLLIPMRAKLANMTLFPYSFNLVVSMTHFEKELYSSVKPKMKEIIRSYLPKGRYWIDNRNDPIYPMVHGDIKAFCSYNSQDPRCTNVINQTSLPQINNIKPPNIAFLVYESMNPLSYLINDSFIDEHIELSPQDSKYYLTDTPYYSSTVMPHLAEYAKEGITFSGMSSFGLPTFSGWHALFTGLVPSQTYMNVIDAFQAHVDDTPSYFRNDGYRTLVVSATKFGFDGTSSWAFRKSAEEEAKTKLHCIDGFGDMLNDPIQQELMKNRKPELRHCTKKEIMREAKNSLSFPRWFDYIGNYFPDESQANILNISRKTLKKCMWQSDRITSSQYQLHWNQQKEFLKRTGQDNKPIFGILNNIEPHIPYHGYDQEDQYEQIDKSIHRMSDEHKKERFIRVNKYTDKHFIHDTIEFFKKEDPNTIVVITGDHGTRDIPIRSKNSPVTNKAVFSGDCVYNPSGVDSFFVTSGTLLYLGDDENVKETLGLKTLKGKTLKVATDHNDLTYTLMDVITKIRGKAIPPTNKLGRNLVEFTQDVQKIINENTSSSSTKVIKYIDDMQWQSVSFLSHQMEYRKGAEFLRTHPASYRGAHYYNVASFPTCMKKINEPDKKLGGNKAKRMFYDMFDFQNINNYLLYHNCIYNYQFRDTKCREKGQCHLPKKLPDINIDDRGFYIAIVGFPLICSIIITIISYIIICFNKIEKIHTPKSNDDEFYQEITEEMKEAAYDI